MDEEIEGSLERWRDVENHLIVGMVEGDDGSIKLVWEAEKTQLEYAREIRKAMMCGNFDHAKRIAAISRLAVDMHRWRKDAP